MTRRTRSLYAHDNSVPRLRKEGDLADCNLCQTTLVTRFVADTNLIDFNFEEKKIRSISGCFLPQMTTKRLKADARGHSEAEARRDSMAELTADLQNMQANEYGIFCYSSNAGFYNTRTYIYHRQHDLIMSTETATRIVPHPSKPLYLIESFNSTYRFKIILGKEAKKSLSDYYYHNFANYRFNGDYNTGITMALIKMIEEKEEGGENASVATQRGRRLYSDLV